MIIMARITSATHPPAAMASAISSTVAATAFAAAATASINETQTPSRIGWAVFVIRVFQKCDTHAVGLPESPAGRNWQPPTYHRTGH